MRRPKLHMRRPKLRIRRPEPHIRRVDLVIILPPLKNKGLP